jgi:hypothetical protein
MGSSGSSTLGSSGGSGGTGGSACAATVMDERANPLLTAALLSSRDATMARGDHVSFLGDRDVNKLLRWDPLVRLNLGVAELTSKLVYDPLAAPNTFKVSCRDANQTLVEMTRPPQTFFNDQLSLVQSWAELRDERTPEILAQIDNQIAFIGAVTGLNMARKRWTMEWLTIAIQFTIAVEMQFKHAFGCYRPVDLSPQVQPIITTPGHGAYPMGHAAEAFASVVALGGLLNIIGKTPIHPAYRQLYLQARRISVNRVVAGVHFPIDAAAGQVLGLSLGEFFLDAAGVTAGSCKNRTFTPTGDGDIANNDYLGDGPEMPPGGALGAVVTITPSTLLTEMTDLARAEWNL